MSLHTVLLVLASHSPSIVAIDAICAATLFGGGAFVLTSCVLLLMFRKVADGPWHVPILIAAVTLSALLGYHIGSQNDVQSYATTAEEVLKTDFTVQAIPGDPDFYRVVAGASDQYVLGKRVEENDPQDFPLAKTDIPLLEHALADSSDPRLIKRAERFASR
jgi:hypothetical protein